MIERSYGIAFDIQGSPTMEDIKRKLHEVLFAMYGNYYDKHWSYNRIKLEVTTQNVFLENDDLTRDLFTEGVVELEDNLIKEFGPSMILAFYIDDSTGGRGFSLLNATTMEKRIWLDSEFETFKNSGSKISEESFIQELREIREPDGDQKVYYHKDNEKPIYGQRGIIETVIRQVLLNRFKFDYGWQEYKGAQLLDSEEFPIQDLQLLFGDS